MTREFKALTPKNHKSSPQQSDLAPKTDETAGQEETAEDDLTTQIEIGGRGGLDPVRYGDWEVKGRCVDF